MSLFDALLMIHIMGGFTSLIVGLYIMFAKKGTKQHKAVGKIYFFAMITAALVALPMSYLHPNAFLFLISIFTIYMLLTGIRYLKKKTLQDVNIFDWILTATMLLFAGSFIVFSIFYIIQGDSFTIVYLVFGGIGFLFSFQDWKNFSGRSRIKNFFLTTHIQRMTGSYIASVTAFLVVNNTVLPSVVAWLLPTAILTPFIVKWVRKYKVKSKAIAMQ